MARLARNVDSCGASDGADGAGVRNDRVRGIEFGKTAEALEVSWHRLEAVNLAASPNERRCDGRQITDIRAHVDEYIAGMQVAFYRVDYKGRIGVKIHGRCRAPLRRINFKDEVSDVTLQRKPRCRSHGVRFRQ